MWSWIDLKKLDLSTPYPPTTPLPCAPGPLRQGPRGPWAGPLGPCPGPLAPGPLDSWACAPGPLRGPWAPAPHAPWATGPPGPAPPGPLCSWELRAAASLERKVARSHQWGFWDRAAASKRTAFNTCICMCIHIYIYMYMHMYVYIYTLICI